MSTSTSNSLLVPATDLERFAVDCLVAAGASRERAEMTAQVLTRTETFGIHSHGLKNLGGYIEKARRGALDLDAEPVALVDGPAFALLDGRNGLGMVSGVTAVRTAIEKARVFGVAIVVVRRSTHYGAAGMYALMAAEAGMIGITASNVDPNMTVPGARGKVIGNNPLAYALPAGETHRPVMFDVALSAVASLKVVKARDEGSSVPEGWIVDGSGRPTTDPSRYPDEGAMMPMAAHKGYGLALLVDALTGVLADAPTSDQVPSWLFDMDRPNDVSHVFVVVDPALLGGAAPYADRVDGFLDRLHGVPLADGSDEVLHPGQLEWRHHDRAVSDGVPLPDDVRASLEALAAAVGVPAPWEGRAD
ncbi:Ldh family oxidoreductase [Cellulomonas shaoxiangyii]|uniref:Ldh family oxidoreductase n=1 Tax=Cellulomonas shaoxiangyii TaxID=2566013 RepID=A0A4P7SIF6_9CELL|nr:Ldh family oxidoreductase [Cellulomonas shaoxiangyii]QCB94019.1 Ldh family oxidoreductase [Cellulomonas shaoxiangyii]TGY85792.1 Ldh family oxidoreductase [Cellulomonas shaoxiangyii]